MRSVHTISGLAIIVITAACSGGGAGPLDSILDHGTESTGGNLGGTPDDPHASAETVGGSSSNGSTTTTTVTTDAGDTGKDSGATTVVADSGTTTNSACAQVAACCATLTDSTEQQNCAQLVQAGDESACASTYAQAKQAGTCP